MLLSTKEICAIIGIMQTGNKFSIKPNAEQAQKLRAWIGCQRHIYNAKVEDMRYQLRLRQLWALQFGVSPEFIAFNQQYSNHKDGVDFLHTVPSQVLRNGAYRFMQSVNRWQKKLGSKPSRKTKHGRQSVLITSELFSVKGNTLFIGTKKFAVGQMHINTDVAFKSPKMISVSVDGNKWFVSFCNDDGFEYPSYEALLDVFANKTKEALLVDSVGIDRGVAINAACSNNIDFVYSDNEKKALLEANKKKKRYHRMMSRRWKHGQTQSNGYYKAKASKQKAERKIKNIRRDFNHKTSRNLADGEEHVIIFEALSLKGMTKAPQPKQDESGKYLPNGANAKAGLNKAILSVAMGQLAQLTEYKANRNHKLLLRVPAHHTSQTCRKCLEVDGKSRVSQSLFICTTCGHTENADRNASGAIQIRGVDLLLRGYFHEQLKKKTRKKVNIRRNAVCGVTVGTA